MAASETSLPSGNRIIDDSFDKHFTRQSSLGILIRDNRLSYSVFDDERQKFVVYNTSYFKNVVDKNSFLGELRSIIGNEEFLHLPFKSVRIGLGYRAGVLVPSDLFVEEELGSHLQIQTPLDKDDRVRVDSLKEYSAMLEYAISAELLDYLLDSFERPNIFHASTALLKAVYKERDVGGDQIFIHVHKEAFTLICFKRSSLQLMNAFEFRSKEDFIYFILAVCREMDVDPETVRLKIVGEAVKESAIFEITRKYIRHVELGSRPDGLSYNRDIRDLPAQFHYNLFALQLCE